MAPVTVAEIELASPSAVKYISIAESKHGEMRQALVLVRLNTRPLMTIVVEAPEGLVDAESCAAFAWDALRVTPHPNDPKSSKNAGKKSIVPDESHTTLKSSTPPVTVVVATRERAESLAVCLDSLTHVDYPNFEVIVIDNDPVTDSTANLVRQLGRPDVRYVREERRGLVAAHNCGLQRAEGTIVAFTDDDVIVDKHWLTEITKAFELESDVACVTGLILAAELQTPAQLLLEAHGHFSKGFEQRVIDLDTYRPADPLFPFTVGRLGSGANMSFDKLMLCELGGFDPAIGTGTIARGGDDLAAFFSVIASGFRLVYQPSALIWHNHHRDFGSLATQAYSYGVGLSAYLVSALTSHPAFLGRALRHAPAGLAYAFAADSPRNAYRRDIWPHKLRRREWRGLAFGPLAYGISRWRTRGFRGPKNDDYLIQ